MQRLSAAAGRHSPNMRLSPHLSAHPRRPCIAQARAVRTPHGGNGQRAATAGVVGRVGQPNQRFSESMANLQSLMARVQEQLNACNSSRFTNPTLATELKAKAERHLELLMQLAESHQDNHIQGSGSSSDIQTVLAELQVQLDLEQQAMQTASAAAAAAAAPNTDAAASASTPATTGTTTSSSSSRGLEQQLERAQDAADHLQERLAAAEAHVVTLQNQLCDAEAQLLSVTEELSEHRELQMAYDRQCQDLYRLRMQLQLERTQGNDAVSLAAQANKQHKQDTAWLMDAHRKELHDAHRKNQELVHQVQQMRLRLLEQEQLVWSLGGKKGQQQQQQQSLEPEQQGDQQQQQQQPAIDKQLLQQQEQAALQLQQLQASAEQLAVDKQQLMRSLQDSQREQAVLLVELQALRSSAAAAAEAAAVTDTVTTTAVVQDTAAAAAAAEAALKAQLQEVQQQRDSLVDKVQSLTEGLQEAHAATAEVAKAAQASAAEAAAVAVAAPAPAAAAAAVVVGSQLDAAAAVEQLKVAKREMAGLRVQLADARRELQQASGRAAAAESALQQQAMRFEARLSALQSWYNRQAAVVAQLRRGQAPKDGLVGFTNTNKFWLRQELLFEFLRHWVGREAQLQQAEGFLGLQVQPGVSVPGDGGVDVVVSSLWESIPAFEAWSKSTAGTQQHMPSGVFQYVPAKGEGFPETFVPFREYDQPVNAKY